MLKLLLLYVFKFMELLLYVTIRRKPAPYGHCISSWDETDMDETALTFDESKSTAVPYTQGVKPDMR